MKTIRSISGIYFKHKNPETLKFENIAFEDLPEEIQDDILDAYNKDEVNHLCKLLANTINEIAEQFNITREK